jgi:hypothetical protein
VRPQVWGLQCTCSKGDSNDVGRCGLNALNEVASMLQRQLQSCNFSDGPCPCHLKPDSRTSWFLDIVPRTV